MPRHREAEDLPLGQSAFTLIEVMVVAAIIGILAAIVVPSYIRARMHAQTNACIGNLTKLEGAKSTWALENKKNSDDVPDMNDLVPNYIRFEPKCPAGTGAYMLNTVGTVTACPNYDASDPDLKLHMLTPNQ